MNYLALFSMMLLTVPGEPTGGLRIRSQPGVEVLWEGVSLGKTDAEGMLVVEDIPPGDYLLTLRAPGYHQIDQRTTIVASDSSVLELPLAATGTLDEHPPRPGPAAETKSASVNDNQILLALAAIVLLATAAWGFRRLRQRTADNIPSSTVPSSTVSSDAIPPRPQPLWYQPPADEPEPPSFEIAAPASENDSPTFLEDLKRREQDLEEVVPGSNVAPEETIIEIEAVEVRRESR